MQPGFQFSFSPDLGIADARVSMMRFKVEDAPWRRFTAEADTRKDEDALFRFVEQLTASLPKHQLTLDQVRIDVRFHKQAGERRARSRPLYITAPNLLRLKSDELGRKISAMLVQSGIEVTSTEDS
jgi:hypothetical protein